MGRFLYRFPISGIISSLGLVLELDSQVHTVNRLRSNQIGLSHCESVGARCEAVFIISAVLTENRVPLVL